MKEPLLKDVVEDMINQKSWGGFASEIPEFFYIVRDVFNLTSDRWREKHERYKKRVKK